MPPHAHAEGNVTSRSRRRRVLDRTIRVVHVDLPIARARILGIVALAVLVAAGATAYASFTASVTPTHVSGTATMTLTLGATGSVTNRFNISSSGLAAGDTVQRTLDLIIGGTSATKRIDLLIQAGASPLRLPSGLRLVIDQCSQPWTEGGSNPAYTSTCGGTTTNLRSDISVDAATWLFTFSLITGDPSGTQHLKATFTLPSAADLATFGGGSLTITFTFTGVQRDGTNK